MLPCGIMTNNGRRDTCGNTFLRNVFCNNASHCNDTTSTNCNTLQYSHLVSNPHMIFNNNIFTLIYSTLTIRIINRVTIIRSYNNIRGNQTVSTNNKTSGFNNSHI
ncbi:hypothetical protein CIFRMA064M2_24250 [Citrobacter freundii]